MDRATKAIKPRRCKHCRTKFTPARIFEVWCSPECGAEIAKAKITKKQAQETTKQRQERRKAKEKLKTRGDYAKEAQAAFNSFIRARDNGLPCISCGKPTKAGDHAGHWKPTSSSPELRFNEQNVHLQCVQCNVFFHGNVANYRKGLIERIGLEAVELLEGQREPKHYSVEELKEIRAKYSKLARELEKQ